MRLAMRVVIVGFAGAVIAALILSSRAKHPREARAELTPDPAAIRYQHPLSGGTGDELASTIAALEQRVKDAPNPFDLAELAELYYRRAQREGDRRDFTTSEAAAQRSVEMLPAPNAAWLTLAKLANARHDFRKAIELARRHSRSSGAELAIATAHLALGELAAAAEAADRAIAIRPDVGGYLTRALVRQAQGLDAEAAADFARAASLEQPGDRLGAARLRTLWGRFLLRRGEYAGAAALFDEALRIVPDFALALACRGELALRTDRPAEAAKLFEQAFVASRQVRYLIDQARAQELAGKLDAANELRAQAEKLVRRELAEEGVGHRLELVEILVDRGGRERLDEAVKLATEELSLRAGFEARYQLARALVRLGRREEAREHVQAALALGTREAQLFELAARLEPDRDAAKKFESQAEAIDPAGAGWRELGIEPL